ncbi:MAG: PhzF family phenazine biosynthesis protein [Anaerolineales bacterium]
MEIPFYQIDAFTNEVFSGNPAGVCLLEEWLPEATLRSIAAENNLPETAFLVPQEKQYDLRWFTPKVEIDLCGHATLASGHVIFTYVDPQAQRAEFMSKSGRLSVERRDDLLFLDFPTRKAAVLDRPEGLDGILGASPTEVLASRDLMAVFEDEDQIRALTPDLDAVAALDYFALIVTAPGRNSDFVSRFFAPGAAIPEDPVTGSAHCTLIPYWSERLGKKELHAFQLSARGGELFCADRGERVSIGGRCVTYLTGSIDPCLPFVLPAAGVAVDSAADLYGQDGLLLPLLY